MIISRTPFRISFVGGGTDLPSFYKKEFGQVLSTTINKYIYVVVKRNSCIAEHKYRINWSKVEFKDRVEDIEHPIVRCAIDMMKIDFPVEITTFADVPAGTGLGSSSSFAVGLLHALFALKGEMVTKNQLAVMASDIEVNELKRSMGKQDHFAASYGDFNVFSFYPDERVAVEPVFYRGEIKQEIEKNLMLFYTKSQRNASEILKAQVENTSLKFQTLKQMRDLASPLRKIFQSGQSLSDIGKILHQSWLLKRTITNSISCQEIDHYYEIALQAGALGGKLLGAGGGGFLLFYVPLENQKRVKESLSELDYLPFKFDGAGTRITYYDQTIL